MATIGAAFAALAALEVFSRPRGGQNWPPGAPEAPEPTALPARRDAAAPGPAAATDAQGRITPAPARRHPGGKLRPASTG